MVKNKKTTKPTARRVFLKFEGIDILEVGGQSSIIGVQEHQARLLKLLGMLSEAVYSLIGCGISDINMRTYPS